jgi:hypothetical protein
VWVHTYEIDFDQSAKDASKPYEPGSGTFYTDIDPWYMRLNVYFVLPSSQTTGPTSTDAVSTAMFQRAACPDFNYLHYDFRTFGGTDRVLQVGTLQLNFKSFKNVYQGKTILVSTVSYSLQTYNLQVAGYSNLTLASRYTWFTNLGTDFTLLDAEDDTSSATVNCATGYQCSVCNADYSLPLLAYRLDDIQYWVTLTTNTQHSALSTQRIISLCVHTGILTPRLHSNLTFVTVTVTVIVTIITQP